MERRLSERVQFFQRPGVDVIVPIWALPQARPDAIQGLVLDVSDEGVQILTDKSIVSTVDTFIFVVQADETSNINFSIATVRRLWSRAEDSRYINHGFSFVGEVNLMSLLDRVFAVRDIGKPWLRCGLIAKIPVISV